MVAPLVAGPTFMPLLLLVPWIEIFIIVVAYVIAIGPTLIAGAILDRVVHTRPGLNSSWRWALIGGGLAAPIGLYLVLGSYFAPAVPETKDVLLMTLGSVSAGASVAAVRWRIAYGGTRSRP